MSIIINLIGFRCTGIQHLAHQAHCMLKTIMAIWHASYWPEQRELSWIIFHIDQKKVTVLNNLKTNKNKQFTKWYAKVNTESSVSTQPGKLYSSISNHLSIVFHIFFFFCLMHAELIFFLMCLFCQKYLSRYTSNVLLDLVLFLFAHNFSVLDSM